MESPFDDLCEPSLLEGRKKDQFNNVLFVLFELTFRVLSQLNDTVHERRPNEHNKPVQELIPNVYIEHRYDIIDRLMLAVHRQKNDYHPIKHDNVMDEMYLEYPHVNINRNHIRLDELLLHRLLFPEEYFHFYRTRISVFNNKQCKEKKKYLFVLAPFYPHRRDVYDVVFERQ